MGFSNPKTILIAAFVSNFAGLLFLLVAIGQPRFARLLFFYFSAGRAGPVTPPSHQHPECYLVYAQKSISLYNDFVNDSFKLHNTVFVNSIPFGQALIAVDVIKRHLGEDSVYGCHYFSAGHCTDRDLRGISIFADRSGRCLFYQQVRWPELSVEIGAVPL
ncbi:hypothetical protein DIU31_003195 [Mucilaginibacter rubeus]|uniref:Uncharacterized protein n=1 Tax=Mucilaginibacter rubeus TaxID=2027860 RepID=A0AAE6MGT5_9SPHI|nr:MULTISPECIES: hypothetical protein [Mucilaginibacter]QEM02569.1 hypothetical protein DIU31_003195 [Mucilaginibacter rubeus]QEM15188.1 hypothetical protein DIU38_003225 [Mucilaginibacter gossypii]QTE42088.1 hypothetical protein J3L19_24580 [Mucilaginibacter rubeus]QTE48689.1 hypothetical protein J3L21_24555 [Mucilaginibacter rubeus]QTE60075.1 hypothetical protein J3L23_16185 [Mucilaginibacter rubeus]